MSNDVQSTRTFVIGRRNFLQPIMFLNDVGFSAESIIFKLEMEWLFGSIFHHLKLNIAHNWRINKEVSKIGKQWAASAVDTVEATEAAASEKKL